MKYQVRPTSVIFYEKKIVCNRSRMIVKILEVWIASKIRLRPGRDVHCVAKLYAHLIVSWKSR